MENSDVVSINSCALDVAIEEFNKKDLQEAGVLIDYDQENEIKIDQKKYKKRPSQGWLRLVFFGILLICLCVVMSVGYALIEDQERIDTSNQLSNLMIQSIEREFELIK